MLALIGPTRESSAVNFAAFQDAISPTVRLIIALVLMVGISIGMVALFYKGILKVTAIPPKKVKDTDPDPPPSVRDVSNRVIALTTFGFVFLFGFAFSQLWGITKDARDAVLSESIDFHRVVALAAQLPDAQRTPMMNALNQYASTIENVEWPLMKAADTDALARVRFASSAKLTDAVYQTRATDQGDQVVWDKLTDSVDDLLSDGIDRTQALPGTLAAVIIGVVFVLGIVNLVTIASFQTTKRSTFLVVVGIMAGVTALMLFALIEISNPYSGAGALTSNLLHQ